MKYVSVKAKKLYGTSKIFIYGKNQSQFVFCFFCMHDLDLGDCETFSADYIQGGSTILSLF